jgi:hypothetical protein
VEVARPAGDADVAAYAERVAVEAKRTWMSYHGSRSTGGPRGSVQLVAVVGEPELAAKIGERCAQTVEVGWEPVGPPAATEFPSWVSAGDRASSAPLVGLLLEESLDRPRLDFANTKKAVDRSAVRRQRVLAGILGLILVGGTGYILAQTSLDRLESRIGLAKEQQNKLRDENERFLLEYLRVNHLEKYRAVRVDWLAHLAAINEQLPDPRQATADEISGRVASEEISFSPKKGEFSDEDWNAQQLSEFVVRGKVDHRDVAADLRGRLVNSRLYTVENKGADVPDKYSLSLLTTQTTPVEKVEAPKPGPVEPKHGAAETKPAATDTKAKEAAKPPTAGADKKTAPDPKGGTPAKPAGPDSKAAEKKEKGQ